MTEKRYYYTDSIAAAWMAKHFGMSFTHEWHNRRLSELSDFFWETSTGDTGTYNTPLYVHPDSLHLLEPQVGDLLRARYLGVVDSIRDKFIEFGESTEWIGDEGSRTGFFAEEVKRIIQRDGKHFHWPECEECVSEDEG
jgi:hypothetical protein